MGKDILCARTPDFMWERVEDGMDGRGREAAD